MENDMLMTILLKKDNKVGQIALTKEQKEDILDFIYFLCEDIDLVECPDLIIEKK